MSTFELKCTRNVIKDYNVFMGRQRIQLEEVNIKKCLGAYSRLYLIPKEHHDNMTENLMRELNDSI